jgi:hypothetical protein
MEPEDFWRTTLQASIVSLAHPDDPAAISRVLMPRFTTDDDAATHCLPHPQMYS